MTLDSWTILPLLNIWDLYYIKVLYKFSSNTRIKRIDIFAPECLPYSSLMISLECVCSSKNKQSRDFPGGPVVESLPSSAVDVGSIPGWRTKIPHASGQLSPCTASREKPTCCNYWAHVLWSLHTTTREACTLQLERSPRAAMKTQLSHTHTHTQKNKQSKWSLSPIWAFEFLFSLEWKLLLPNRGFF